ncbi:MAG: aryldialkylphosphatase [Spirochaetes bacterium]|nr:aryldialkylphosphatase [Spirochaetota bacterium]
MEGLKGRIQTVRGAIEPGELGFVLSHEHLFINLLPEAFRSARGEPIIMEKLGSLRRNWASNVENLSLESEEDAVYEMGVFKRMGGGTLVEQTVCGLLQNPQALARVSERTGVNIVAGTGLYSHQYHPPEIAELDESRIAERFVREITEGIEGTGVRAGIIGEIGLSWPVHPDEERVLRAAVRAQRETGASLSIHPGKHHEAPRHAVEVILQEKGDPERCIMCHIERTYFDIEPMVALAETGCCLEFDLFGQEYSYFPTAPIDMPNDAVRINFIMKLIDAGHLERILVSQDICRKIHLTRFGGEGYYYLMEYVLPMMRRKGMSDHEIDALTRGNPARMLAFL